MVKLYSDTTENIPWILIIKSATSYNFKVAYSVPLTAKKGDVISASFRGEITSQQAYNVQIGTFIKLGASATDSAQSGLILPAAGENVTPAMHHMVIAGGCGHEFAEDFSGFVNVVVYANSDAAGSDNTISIEQGYGRLDVLHFEKDVVIPPTDPGDTSGSVTLTAAQRQQVLSALLDGAQERIAAAALLQ